MGAGSRSGVRLAVAIGFCLSLALNVALGYRYRHLASDYKVLRSLSRLPQAGLQYPVFKSATAHGDTVLIGSAPAETRQLILVMNRSCPYCARTIPLWRGLVRETQTDGLFRLQAYAIALDTAAATQRHLDSLGLSIPVVEFPEPRLARLARATQVPQTLVLDHEGRIRFAHIGVFASKDGIDSLRRAVGLPGSFTDNQLGMKGGKP